MTVGYGKDVTNQLSDTYNAKYGWVGDKEQSLHQELIGSSYVLGLSVGAGLAGRLIQSGRRSAHLIAIGVGLVGVSLSLISNFYFLIGGRLIFGLAAGTLCVAGPRLTEEYCPMHLQSAFIPFYHTSIYIGSSLALFSGELLPPADDPEALKSS